MEQIIELTQLPHILLILMKNGWEKSSPSLSDLKLKGNTIIGNDVG